MYRGGKDTFANGALCAPCSQVMFMAYHSEVLQKEREMLRKNRLSSPRGAGEETAQGQEESDSNSNGMRRAGGGSHRFSVMAEAALAQVNRLHLLVHCAGNLIIWSPIS